MGTIERLAELRHEQPVMFWVWKTVVHAMALIGVRGAAGLRELIARSE